MSNHFECSICLKKQIDDGDRIVKLCECNHEFHVNCLKKWFEQDWVDIGSKKKGGGFSKCGRSKLKARYYRV